MSAEMEGYASAESGERAICRAVWKREAWRVKRGELYNDANDEMMRMMGRVESTRVPAYHAESSSGR